MKKQPEVGSAPTSCSAQLSQPGTSRSEASNSPFRATVPVEELERRIDELLSEARKDRKRSQTMYGDGEFVCRFANGQIFALEELLKWLNSHPDQQALARNNASATPVVDPNASAP